MRRTGVTALEIVVALTLLIMVAIPFIGLTRGSVGTTQRTTRALAAETMADMFLAAVIGEAAGSEAAFDRLEAAFDTGGAWRPIKQFPRDTGMDGTPMFTAGGATDLSTGTQNLVNLYASFEYRLDIQRPVGGAVADRLARVLVELRWDDPKAGGKRDLARSTFVSRRHR